jgi:hypothetical protein
MALLLAAGANAGWLFFTLTKAGLQFRDAEKAALDSAETGRVMAGVLAQPGFLLVFAVGLIVGPICAWLLVRQSRGLSALAGHLRVAAAALLLASSMGAGQMVLAKRLADLAMERTGALVSHDQAKADQVRGELDRLHDWSEKIYGGQIIFVALGMVLMTRPTTLRDDPASEA